jgi:hypothetical protein
MEQLKRLKVKRFVSDHVDNPFPGGQLPWQVYHAVRNAVVRTCRRYGPTGPMGEVRIDGEVADPYMHLAQDINSWEAGDPDPTYFILDDQLNHERYIYAELLDADALTVEWLAAVVAALREFPGWGLAVSNIPDAYVLIFGDKLLVKGRAFESCRDAVAVAGAAQQQLRRGPKRWWEFWK